MCGKWNFNNRRRIHRCFKNGVHNDAYQDIFFFIFYKKLQVHTHTHMTLSPHPTQSFLSLSLSLSLLFKRLQQQQYYLLYLLLFDDINKDNFEQLPNIKTIDKFLQIYLNQVIKRWHPLHHR